uniref:Cytochrome b-c1 complex subunit 7 n=1 Tax=Catagonus wagneri TaxID=51154 RepID=A0A8C3W4E6_9CETA
MAGRQEVTQASSKWLEGMQKRYHNAARFNKLGLMHDDTIYEDEKDTSIRRVFCIKRALDLTMRPQILRKEQWTNCKENKFYLEPYPREVIRERKERAEWAKK